MEEEDEEEEEEGGSAEDEKNAVCVHGSGEIGRAHV